MHKRFVTFFFLVLGSVASSNLVHAQSWCSANKLNATERTICSNSKLGALDRKIVDLYGSGKIRGKKDWQLSWLRDRNSCGTDEHCIERSYRAGIATLEESVASQSSSVVQSRRPDQIHKQERNPSGNAKADAKQVPSKFFRGGCGGDLLTLQHPDNQSEILIKPYSCGHGLNYCGDIKLLTNGQVIDKISIESDEVVLCYYSHLI